MPNIVLISKMLFRVVIDVFEDIKKYLLGLVAHARTSPSGKKLRNENRDE